MIAIRKNNLTLGMMAPSSVIPKIEFELGVQKLESEGFAIKTHASVFGSHLFYAGSDEMRAKSILDFAFDDEVNALWSVRGGYGATHLLPLLEKATKRKKPKKKILLGYSDSSALLEFVRVKWGWKTIHSPMPALKTFSDLPENEWSTLLNLIQTLTPAAKTKKLSSCYDYHLASLYLPKNLTKKNPLSIQAPVVGGNFAVWNSLIGTPYAGNARGKILFFEEINENIARLNRMIHHLEQSGGFKGVKAIVLGDFLDCKDSAPLVFKTIPHDLRNPTPEELMPLREVLGAESSLAAIFSALGERTSIPVFSGLPLGHGVNQFSLALGEKHSLTVKNKTISLSF